MAGIKTTKVEVELRFGNQQVYKIDALHHLALFFFAGPKNMLS